VRFVAGNPREGLGEECDCRLCRPLSGSAGRGWRTEHSRAGEMDEAFQLLRALERQVLELERPPPVVTPPPQEATDPPQPLVPPPRSVPGGYLPVAQRFSEDVEESGPAPRAVSLDNLSTVRSRPAWSFSRSSRKDAPGPSPVAGELINPSLSYVEPTTTKGGAVGRSERWRPPAQASSSSSAGMSHQAFQRARGGFVGSAPRWKAPKETAPSSVPVSSAPAMPLRGLSGPIWRRPGQTVHRRRAAQQRLEEHLKATRQAPGANYREREAKPVTSELVAFGRRKQQHGARTVGGRIAVLQQQLSDDAAVERDAGLALDRIRPSRSVGGFIAPPRTKVSVDREETPPPVEMRKEGDGMDKGGSHNSLWKNHGDRHDAVEDSESDPESLGSYRSSISLSTPRDSLSMEDSDPGDFSSVRSESDGTRDVSDLISLDEELQQSRARHRPPQEASAATVQKKSKKNPLRKSKTARQRLAEYLEQGLGPGMYEVDFAAVEPRSTRGGAVGWTKTSLDTSAGDGMADILSLVDQALSLANEESSSPVAGLDLVRPRFTAPAALKWGPVVTDERQRALERKAQAEALQQAVQLVHMEEGTTSTVPTTKEDLVVEFARQRGRDVVEVMRHDSSGHPKRDARGPVLAVSRFTDPVRQSVDLGPGKYSVEDDGAVRPGLPGARGPVAFDRQSEREPVVGPSVDEIEAVVEDREMAELPDGAVQEAVRLTAVAVGDRALAHVAPQQHAVSGRAREGDALVLTADAKALTRPDYPRAGAGVGKWKPVEGEEFPGQVPPLWAIVGDDPPSRWEGEWGTVEEVGAARHEVGLAHRQIPLVRGHVTFGEAPPRTGGRRLVREALMKAEDSLTDLDAVDSVLWVRGGGITLEAATSRGVQRCAPSDQESGAELHPEAADHLLFPRPRSVGFPLAESLDDRVIRLGESLASGCDAGVAGSTENATHFLSAPRHYRESLVTDTPLVDLTRQLTSKAPPGAALDKTRLERLLGGIDATRPGSPGRRRTPWMGPPPSPPLVDGMTRSEQALLEMDREATSFEYPMMDPRDLLL
jgi:hypothetical protein